MICILSAMYEYMLHCIIHSTNEVVEEQLYIIRLSGNNI